MDDAVLAVRDLFKSFGALVACDGVSLDLRPGEIHALIGPNGAGKSTLIKQICGGLTPDRGSIQFLRQDVGKLTTAHRASLGWGRTFQISALATEYTVLENAVIGALGESGSPFRFFKQVMKDMALLATAMAALERVGLSDRANIPVFELSHGERRRLEVAVALTLSPKAFLMDEPMAGLGADGSQALTKLLAALKDEAPILLVEHDMDAVFALADRVSVLVYGRIIATGTVQDIRTNRDVQDAYLGEGAAS